VLNAGAEVVSANDEFDLTFAASIGRPWFSSRVLPEPGDPIYDQILGTQLFNLRRYDEACVFVERAFKSRPDSPDLAGNLAQIYLALGRNPDVIRILTPFLNQAAPPKYDVYILAGEAYKRSAEFAKALEILNQAVSHYGVNASLLKAIGDAYLGQGKIPEALAAFEKSLQLSPAQPELQKKITELKTKK
jgi:tetratricopeptide (TPR) repeat protein